MDSDSHPLDQTDVLSRLAETSNETLETSGQSGATRAFNLGCSMALLPGLILVIVVYFLARSSWVAASIAAMLVMIVILGLANLAAYTAKGKTIERTYQRDISPEIERTLNAMGVSRPSFDNLANDILPENAPLRTFIETQTPLIPDDPEMRQEE